MARQLAASGEPPALLVLLDPVSGVAPVSKTVKEAMDGDVGGSAVDGRTARSPMAADRATGRAPNRAAFAERVTWFRPLGAAAFFYTSRRMKHRYRPPPYNGRTLLVRTTIWEQYDRIDLRRLLTGDVTVSAAKGTHQTLIEEPQVADVAAILRRALGDAEESFSRDAARRLATR